jgi:hypothetical protein
MLARRLRPLPFAPPGTSACAYEKPLEAIPSGPQLRFGAIQLPTPLACELQLAFDVVECLGCELSPYLRIPGVLEALPHETECFLGLEHAAGCLLRRAEYLPQLRDRLSEGRFSSAFVRKSRRGEWRLYVTGLHGQGCDLLPLDRAR